jgi:fused signal recognition particle receptor
MENLFDKWKHSLDRTRKVTFGRIASLFGASDISSDTWDELEAILLQADLGIDTTTSIIKSLQKKVNDNGYTRSSELQQGLQDELMSRLSPIPAINFSSTKPFIILLVGVNGSGKTTTAAKLGKQFSESGYKVLLAAADTYRAAAVDQLQVWGDRLKIPVITGQPNADPGSVAYDSVQASVSRDVDITLIDTAGRLHTRYNLMEELKKVYRVVGKALPGAPHAVWLVLDATTGQNALQQAKSFKEAVNVSGVIITKLDSSARGGMLLAIQKELNLPILYAGLGEKPEDLQVFNREAYINGLLPSGQ